MLTTDHAPEWETLIPYVELLSLVGETNRCPGGKAAIGRIARSLFLGPHSRVLEVGCNTGFTSIELVSVTGCSVVGIDVNPVAIGEAEKKRELLPQAIRSKLTFEVVDAVDLPWAGGCFDAAVCGGALGFVADRARVLSQIRHVLRPGGMVSITHLYYETQPPAELLHQLARILGFHVPPWGWQEWLKELAPPEWEIYQLRRRVLTSRPPDIVGSYLRAVPGPRRLAHLPEAIQQNVRDQWRRAIEIFNINHHYLGVMELLLRFPIPGLEEQPELFVMPGEFDPHFSWDFVPNPQSAVGA